MRATLRGMRMVDEGLVRWPSIAADLRARILGGVRVPPGDRLGPGDELPTETELADQHGANRNTVRRALEQLEREGLIRRRRPRPAVVVGRAPRCTTGGTAATEPGALTVAIEDTPDDLADVFTGAGTPPGGPPGREVPALLARRVVLTGSDGPYGIVTARYPLTMAASSSLASPGDGSGAAVDVATLTALGNAPVLWVDEISARAATDDEAAVLDVAPGHPVAETRTTGYDTDGRPVVHVVAVTARTTLRYERRTSR